MAIEIVNSLTNQGQLHIAFDKNICNYWVWNEGKKTVVLRVKSKDIFSYKRKIQSLGKDLKLLDYVKTAIGTVAKLNA